MIITHGFFNPKLSAATPKNPQERRLRGSLFAGQHLCRLFSAIHVHLEPQTGEKCMEIE